MANRNRLDEKGRPFKKLDSKIAYIGKKYYKDLRTWTLKLRLTEQKAHELQSWEMSTSK